MNFLNFTQDFSRLRQFYFVAQAGSLSGAARILNVSHATLCKSMQTLQHRLKTKLFIRQARGMKLTSDGERLLEHTLKSFQDNEAFLKSFMDKGDEISGDIHIKTTPYFADVELTPYLLQFLEKYPNVNIKVSTTIDDFDVETADVAIRTNIANRPDLEQLPLHRHHHKFWASAEYLKKFGVPKKLEDLDQHKLLAYGKHNNFYYTHSLNWLLSSGISEPRKPFFQLTSHGGLAQAAILGHGIVQLPQEWVACGKLPLVELLPSLLETPKVELFFIYNKKYAKIKRLNTLYKFLYNCFNEEE
jgi:DNA-binding transcriptional LysR family regulator